MTQIILVQTNSGLSIIQPIEKSVNDLIQDLPPNTVYCVIDSDIMPECRCFRNAWVLENNTITINITIAKSIYLDFWRLVRKSLLIELDAQWFLASESNDTAALMDIASKKQTLRDVTLTDLSLVTNNMELIAVWPECLGTNPCTCLCCNPS